jgi:hypothetical protein
VYILVKVHMASASPGMRPSIAMSSAYHPPRWLLHPWLYSEDRAWLSATTTSREKKKNESVKLVLLQVFKKSNKFIHDAEQTICPFEPEQIFLAELAPPYYFNWSIL